MSVADNLNKAADLIEQRGWVRGALIDAHNRMCIRGAINMARTGDPVGWDTHAEDRAVAEFLNLPEITFQSRANDLAIWNNKKERKQEEVIAALRGAAQAQLAEA